MKAIIKISIIFVLLVAFAGTNTFGDNASSREPGDRRHGPPPEAYTACEGKCAGDTAQLVDPQGETVTGTCEQEGDRLVLRPDHPKPRHVGKAENPQRGTQK